MVESETTSVENKTETSVADPAKVENTTPVKESIFKKNENFSSLKKKENADDDDSTKNSEEKSESEPPKKSIFAGIKLNSKPAKHPAEDSQPANNFNFKKFSDGSNTNSPKTPSIEPKKAKVEDYEDNQAQNNFLVISPVKVYSLDKESNKWTSLFQGEFILRELEDKTQGLQVLIRQSVLRTTLLNAIMPNSAYEMEVIEASNSARVQIILSTCPSKEESAASTLQSYMIQGQKEKIKLLKRFIPDYFGWNKEQAEVDDAYEEFLAQANEQQKDTPADSGSK